MLKSMINPDSSGKKIVSLILITLFLSMLIIGCKKEIPEMVYVEGGTFQMGSNDGLDNEKPVHSITVDDFYIGKYEVTQKEWKAVMNTSTSLSNPSSFKGDNRPVESVSWYDAVNFCNKKSEMEGLEPCYSGSDNNIKCDFTKNGYRLPTEAEWEYAARAGNKTRGYKYTGSNNIDEVAWYWKNSGDEKLSVEWDWDKIVENNSQTHPVGQKKPNKLGIYDISGNVWEWCWDWYDEDFYNSSPSENPTGTDNGSDRVSRGGSWSSYSTQCRVADRYYFDPDDSEYYMGFRLSRTDGTD